MLREELREGSDLFSIHAFLPAEASFGFADDMRRRSSGAASASLMLSHWERLQASTSMLKCGCILVYRKYWTLNLMPLMVYPKVLFGVDIHRYIHV